MKSLELKPTYENLLNTLVEDTLGRNRDIRMFADIINSADDSCSIALDGGWGSGKTFFVQQTKMLLDANNPFVETINQDDCEVIKTALRFRQEMDYEPQFSVYYDAWENDNDSEPVLSLVYSIVNSVCTDYVFSDNITLLKKAATILEFFSNKNWEAVVDAFRSERPLDGIRRSKNIKNEIKEFLDSLLGERGHRLVIFIDELDRCKPSYAVNLLERIKHYFDNDRITFVFSINTLELQHTIKKHYGENFDACRYLDRFFDIRASIPQLDLSKLYYSIDFDNTHYTFDMVCDKVMRKYNFTIREIAKFIRLTKLAAFVPTHNGGKFSFAFNDGRAKEFCLHYIVPIMMGLNVHDRNLYERFINGQDHTPLTEVVLELEPYYFRDMLEFNETYDEKDTEKTLVRFEDKIIQIYNALFSKNVSAGDVTIGKYCFGGTIKQFLFKVVSLFSEYSNSYVKSES